MSKSVVTTPSTSATPPETLTACVEFHELGGSLGGIASAMSALSLPLPPGERRWCAQVVKGVLVEAGMPFYIDPEDGRHRFRLGFSSIPAERIGEGVRRLRAVTDAMG